MNSVDNEILAKTLKTYDLCFFRGNCSRISKEGHYNIIGNYNYYTSDDYVFYDVYRKIFIDKNKNIIFFSNHIFQNIFYIRDKIDELLQYIDKLDLNNYIEIDGVNEVISIQTWAETYGHFLDEITNLYEFEKLFAEKNNTRPKILLNFNETNMYNNDNYVILTDILFDNFINIRKNVCGKLIKINKLHIVENSYNCKTFHSFPSNSINRIITNLSEENNIYLEKAFISRNGSGWNNIRILKNKEEVEELIKGYGYDLIFPEIISLKEFIDRLRSLNKVFITWGSALTNMIFLKPNTNIIILKSESYFSENIKLFEKIIKNNNLNIVEILDEKQLGEKLFLEKIKYYLEKDF